MVVTIMQKLATTASVPLLNASLRCLCSHYMHCLTMCIADVLVLFVCDPTPITSPSFLHPALGVLPCAWRGLMQKCSLCLALFVSSLFSLNSCTCNFLSSRLSPFLTATMGLGVRSLRRCALCVCDSSGTPNKKTKIIFSVGNIEARGNALIHVHRSCQQRHAWQASCSFSTHSPTIFIVATPLSTTPTPTWRNSTAPGKKGQSCMTRWTVRAKMQKLARKSKHTLNWHESLCVCVCSASATADVLVPAAYAGAFVRPIDVLRQLWHCELIRSTRRDATHWKKPRDEPSAFHSLPSGQFE